MNTISSYRSPTVIRRSGTPNVVSSREQELEQRLDERLTNRLSQIRQQITSSEPKSGADSGRVLDISA